MATSTSLRSTAIHSEIRGEFTTKEGTYRNVKASEHCRPSRQPLFGKELSPVQVSFVSCKGKDGLCEWIVFNSGKELYFYRFEGVGKIPDLKHPLDKRVYKAPTIPVCHDFNIMTRSPEHLDLVVGFSTGPLQYLSPLEKHAVCAFNEDASIDNTRVTCVKWVPGSEHSFVSSHRSGNLYVWSTENHTTSKVATPTNYVLHKEVLDAKVYHVKQRNKSPLLSRWAVGHGPINAFAFSPDCIHIAISSQDGFLRIYDFQKQEIYGRMRSYFGGLLCVCWSPDGKYTVQINVGDPNDPSTMMGALVSKEHLSKVTGYVNLAREEGCRVLCGHGVDPLSLPEKNRNGYFMRPTVITEVSDDSCLMQEEVFGPVTCIVPFKTEEEVIERSNHVQYGLSACVWSENSGITHRVAQALNVGTVWVNCWLVRDLNVPFGGAKMSGIGREGLKDSLEFYTEVKTICIKH